MSRQERKTTWTSQGINQWRKKQIIAFCRQYDEWKTELIENKDKKRQMDAESAAEDMARDAAILKKIDIVESAIRDTCPEIYDQMLDNIARGVSFRLMDIPMCQADFFAKRKAVYAAINEILN